MAFADDQCADAYVKAQRLRKSGKLLDSRDQLLLCGDASCDPQLRSDCTTWLVDLNRSIPSVVVSLRTHDGKDVALAALSIDGKQIEQRLTGRAFELDPGEHVVRIDAPNEAPLIRTVVLGDGEQRRSVVLELPAKGGTRTRPIPWPVYALAGLALAGTGVAIAFGVDGLSAHSSLEPCKGMCSSDAVARVDRSYVVANVAMGVSLTAAIGAIVWFLARPTVTVERSR